MNNTVKATVFGAVTLAGLLLANPAKADHVSVGLGLSDGINFFSLGFNNGLSSPRAAIGKNVKSALGSKAAGSKPLTRTDAAASSGSRAAGKSDAPANGCSNSQLTSSRTQAGGNVQAHPPFFSSLVRETA